MGSDKIPGRTTSIWQSHGSTPYVYYVSYPRTRDNAESARHDKGSGVISSSLGTTRCFIYKGISYIGKIPPREGFPIMYIHDETWICERDDSSLFV